jgi:uncharacterized protein YkwD
MIEFRSSKLGGKSMSFRFYFGLAAAGLITSLTASPASALDINSFRRANGLPPLHTSAQLARAAAAHARDMAQRNHLDHDGFYSRTAGYSVAAENVAVGCSNAGCTYNVWANSSGHRFNMLLSGIKQYGLASAKASNGTRYWVLELSN